MPTKRISKADHLPLGSLSLDLDLLSPRAPSLMRQAMARLASATLPDDGPDDRRTTLFRPLPPDPLAWLQRTFAHYFQDSRNVPVPFAAHHTALWQWLWQLRPGQPASSYIAIWARGGGKSTTIELGASCIAYYGLRRYALYVCATQAQADDHVASIATAMEQLGLARALNTYGYSRGWRVNRLRTADGFTVDAVSLEMAARGIRMDEYRPDMIFLDELDDQSDTPDTIRKKIETLTQKILPTGANSLAVLGVQNLPNTNGIFAQLADDRAEFLLDRTVSGPHPALRDLPETDWYTRDRHADGPTTIRLLAGEPTWQGQDRAACEKLIATIGPTAFLIECQHRGAVLHGTLFRREWFQLVTDWPPQARMVRSWDFASTEAAPGHPDPDWTVGLLVAERGGQYWVIDMQRVRYSPKDVEDLVLATALTDGVGVPIILEQEPGSSGAAVVEDYVRRVLKGFPVSGKRWTGSKAERAKPASSAAENGNVFILRAPWADTFLEEVPRFGLPDVHDDIVDTFSAAVLTLAGTDDLSGLSLAENADLDQPGFTARVTDAGRKVIPLRARHAPLTRHFSGR